MDLAETAEKFAPQDLPVLMTKGRAFEALQQFGASTAVYDKVVMLFPEQSDPKIALAGAALAAGQIKKSIATCFAVLADEPDNQKAKLVLAHALIEDGRLTRALEMFNDLPPSPAVAHIRRQIAWLDRATDIWAEQAAAARADWSPDGAPVWDGGASALPVIIDAGRLPPEDVIQLARLLPDAAARAGQGLVVHCDFGAAHMLANVEGVADVRPDEKPREPAHAPRLPLIALPAALGFANGELPTPIPYLSPSPERDRPWTPAQFVSNEPQVAICWREQGLRVGPNQDLPFTDFEAVLDGMPARFVSLAYQRGPNDDGHMRDLGIFNAEDLCRDLDDVTAMLRRMDLVIACDGIIPHLAGALGKECWLILPIIPDWRWGRDATSSAHYPSVRYFRAERGGGGAPVLAEVRAALAERLGQDRPVS